MKFFNQLFNQISREAPVGKGRHNHKMGPALKARKTTVTPTRLDPAPFG